MMHAPSDPATTTLLRAGGGERLHGLPLARAKGEASLYGSELYVLVDIPLDPPYAYQDIVRAKPGPLGLAITERVVHSGWSMEYFRILNPTAFEALVKYCANASAFTAWKGNRFAVAMNARSLAKTQKILRDACEAKIIARR